MGLFSSIGRELERGLKKAIDPFGLVDVGGIKRGVEDITGKTARRAVGEAADVQVDFQQQIFDLLSPNIQTQQQISQAGLEQLPFLQAGATAEGFGLNIGDILSGGALDTLIAERQRASEASLSKRGLLGSGAAATAAAQIPADLALQIESELNRRRQSIAQQGQTGVVSGIQGAIGGLGGIGEARAGGILGDAQARAQGTANVIDIGKGFFDAFSDPSLKTNIVKIGAIGPANVYQWDWNEKAESIGLAGDSSGFMADEILLSHPHHVFMNNDLLTIDYDGLLQDLKHGNTIQ